MIRVELRPAAAADLEEAAFWYEARRRGLGLEFIAAVRSALAVIADTPEAWPVIHRRTRRVLLERFPYAIYYRLYPGRVLVVACLHGRRDPRRWQARK